MNAQKGQKQQHHFDNLNVPALPYLFLSWPSSYPLSFPSSSTTTHTHSSSPMSSCSCLSTRLRLPDVCWCPLVELWLCNLFFFPTIFIREQTAKLRTLLGERGVVKFIRNKQWASIHASSKISFVVGFGAVPGLGREDCAAVAFELLDVFQLFLGSAAEAA